jgi:hypothetical protein
MADAETLLPNYSCPPPQLRARNLTVEQAQAHFRVRTECHLSDTSSLTGFLSLVPSSNEDYRAIGPTQCWLQSRGLLLPLGQPFEALPL